MHSAYALAFGVGFMWLGARHYAFLRVAGFHIAFIWSTSLLLARAGDWWLSPPGWWGYARLAINYVNKNFYQQILFFILPIYYASATGWSRNMVFVALLSTSAVVSTLDLFYDRYLTTRPALSASFFSFNLFACVNVALPVLWSVSNAAALRVAAVGAVVGFVTIARRPSQLADRATWVRTALGAIAVLLVVEVGKPWVPPAPLRLGRTDFGTSVDADRIVITSRVDALPPDRNGRIYAVTALRAPLGLKDTVELRWFGDGRRLWASAPHEIVGGRAAGFLLWSSTRITTTFPSRSLRLDVVTEAGQLIGRAVLIAAR
jgi:hypothetical protein